jgi:hypothetical protein
MPCEARTFSRRNANFQRDFSYQRCILTVSDEGAIDEQELAAAEKVIRSARADTPFGSVVLLYVHGWRHDASDNDDHLDSFFRIVESVVVREAEGGNQTRSPRQVVGIYVGWHGLPKWARTLRWLSLFSFYGRYWLANRIGKSGGFRTAIKRIIRATKDPEVPRNDREGRHWYEAESSLVLAGHSMGSLILQSALEALLKDGGPEVIFKSRMDKLSHKSAVKTTECKSSMEVFFPNLLLCLNSAASSGITSRIISKLDCYSREARAPGVQYGAPLLVSLTSTRDWSTKFVWPASRLFLAKTDGHDQRLFTHVVKHEQDALPHCQKREDVPDFGQPWHCLHVPQGEPGQQPVFHIDLPSGPRAGDDGKHERWTIAPRDSTKRRIAWVFQVPKQISNGHGDIFDVRASALFLALLQISGAVVGLAGDFERNFEEFNQMV